MIAPYHRMIAPYHRMIAPYHRKYTGSASLCVFLIHIYIYRVPRSIYIR